MTHGRSVRCHTGRGNHPNHSNPQFMKVAPAGWALSWPQLTDLLAKSSATAPARSAAMTTAAPSPIRTGIGGPRMGFAEGQGLGTPGPVLAMSYGRADNGIEGLMRQLDNTRLRRGYSPGQAGPRSPQREMSPLSPSAVITSGLLGSSSFGDSRQAYGSMGNVSPAAAKRRLRVEAVSERVASIRDNSHLMKEGRRSADLASAAGTSASLSSRISALEQRLAKGSNQAREKQHEVEEKIHEFDRMLEEDARRAEKSIRSFGDSVSALREQVGAGQVKQEMTEVVAPRVYKFLMMSGEGLQLNVNSEASPVKHARHNLRFDNLVSQLKVKSDSLDEIIHQHGVKEEALSQSIKSQIEQLNAGIEEERAKRKHMESVFVALMESIITRLYQEMNETFNERRAMSTRLHTRLEEAVASIRVQSM
eukprot:TRINITY_DN10159_c0_g1_i2.p1 TRINITY_DN10159_c0_g1~~TRINITY_DN10159_c0_g1_i2.p1  ORF type:complete len:421 (+),score=107.44 TRINITY_DN10159_c0_g1_i2:728-1990(+)